MTFIIFVIINLCDVSKKISVVGGQVFHFSLLFF